MELLFWLSFKQNLDNNGRHFREGIQFDESCTFKHKVNAQVYWFRLSGITTATTTLALLMPTATTRDEKNT